MTITAYAVRGGDPYPVAAVTDHDALGLMLTTLRAEGQLDDNDRVGLLLRANDDEVGTWLINPYAKGRP